MVEHDTIHSMPRWTILCILIFALTLAHVPPLSAQNEAGLTHVIQPGDTWLALSTRFDVSQASLIDEAGTINSQRQPIIGTNILLHEVNSLNGKLLRPLSGGMVETAVRHGRSPWEVSLRGGQNHPYAPLLYTPIFLPGGDKPPVELPTGFSSMAISKAPANPGEALGIQAWADPVSEAAISLQSEPWNTFWNGHRLLAIGATDAFFGAGTPELSIQVAEHPTWTQPWLFEDKDWFYDQVSFAATAANEQESMQLERAQLKQIWGQITPEPLWTSTFAWPLEEYVELSSHFGARRSVNGGPYNTYHEGTDFSAYRGTPVLAPAGGKVVLAEFLVVRGGAIIIDHGLGIYSGYYHLSDIKVLIGDEVGRGDVLGEVGTTGRSTGNHLHWDMLIGTTWVDAEDWMKGEIGDWIRAAWAGPLSNQDHLEVPSIPK